MISDNHWRIEGYSERITAKQWRKMLLDGSDEIICHGSLRKLVAKKLGYGVIEISKKPLKEDTSNEQ
jgi:hypothetical protein